MNNKKTGFTVKLILAVSALLLVTNLLLGAMLVTSSRSSMKSLISSRMLDISNTAASMLDGDVLEKLTKEDVNSPGYQKTLRILSHFQENTDLRYIYCVQKLDDTHFAFSVDPTVLDPGEFGEPVVYTDALYKASKGKASADQEPYTDRWGTFYSAYSPVLNSKGEVAGIVAVDFDAAWYEDRIFRQNLAIIINSAVTVFVAVLIIIFITARMRRSMRTLDTELQEISEELSKIAVDVEEQPEGKETADSPESTTAGEVQRLSRRIRMISYGLTRHFDTLHDQANSMITALSSEYRSVFYVDLDADSAICYQAGNDRENELMRQGTFSYLGKMQEYARTKVAEKYREAFIRFTDPANIRRNLEKEKLITFRYRIVRNGVESYEMVRIAGVRHPEDRADKMVHAIGFGFADVDAETRKTLTQSQALKDALAVAEVASKAKTVFLSNMSHEIRTPMNAIIGLDRIALNDPDISPATRDHLEKIGSAAEHLLKIINNILDMSRIEAGKMTLRREIFSLGALLEQIDVMLESQCREKGITWRWDIRDDHGGYYLGDAMKIKQVLINILSNAVKFTPEHGRVTFNVRQVGSFEHRVTYSFEIKDTGIGMSREYLEKIFEPFSQEDASARTKYGSTGLGMSITKRIVDMMNGDIAVESEKNVGTKFTVTLTFDEAEKPLEAGEDMGVEAMSVLVVDDDPIACEYARMELEKTGAAAEIALSGAEAVQMVRLRNARREPYSLILLDWQMPEMDGLETARQIRDISGGDETVLILISAHWDDMLEEAGKAGIDTFVSKPLQTDTLMGQFRQLRNLKIRNARKKADLTGKRILLAEDIAINAEIITMLLKVKKVQVDTAGNGRIALEKFTASPVNHYDAILMDLRMPEMDGLEAAREIRKLDRPDARTVPIIALTANAFDEDVQKSLQAGMNAHLSKPVDPASLYETMESLVGSGARGQG